MAAPVDTPAPIASAHLYPGSDSDHALQVHRDVGAADARFCAQHAARGVDVWTMPDTTESISDSVATGQHIAESTGLPVFVYGSSRGALTAYRALQASNVFTGGVLVIDAKGAFELVRDAHRSDISLRHNTKPILNVVVESDRTVASKVADSIIRASGGPVEAHVEPRWSAHSDIVLEWCLRQLSNHLVRTTHHKRV